MAKRAVLLLAHGTPETVEQIPEYLRNVVSGRPVPQAVVEEIQHRYALIGHSPLTEITLAQARLVEAELNRLSETCSAGCPGDKIKDAARMGRPWVPVYVGMRNWRPYIAEVVEKMRADGIEEAAVICMAPQNSRTSVGLYRRAVEAEAAGLRIDFTEGWARHPLLADAFAERLRPALAKLSAEVGEPVPVLFTAHSVPTRTVEAQRQPASEPADQQVPDRSRPGDENQNVAKLHPTDKDLSVGAPVLHPTHEDLSVGAPVLRPTHEDLSVGAPVLRPTHEDLSVGAPVLHPTHEDLSVGAPVLHPTHEDLSVGAPVLHPTDEDLSVGAPVMGQPDAARARQPQRQPVWPGQGADPYAEEARHTAELVAQRVPEIARWWFAFQSQGASGGPWLGPSVEEMLDKIAGEGVTALVLQPIGFLCDHVEILYDVDRLFREYAAKRNVRLERPESLNESVTLARAVADLARKGLGRLEEISRSRQAWRR